MEYNFNEHKHRFAVWTAARAVQRNFAKTKTIIEAIECANLKQFCELDTAICQEDFDRKQKEWCNLIIKYFNKEGETEKRSYGRASKIIAIYLKTSYLIPNKGETKNCEVIHPPIDRILLNNLARKQNIKELQNFKWTNFEDHNYEFVMNTIRNKGLIFNWTLEKYWDINPKEEEDGL